MNEAMQPCELIEESRIVFLLVDPDQFDVLYANRRMFEWFPSFTSSAAIFSVFDESSILPALKRARRGKKALFDCTRESDGCVLDGSVRLFSTEGVNALLVELCENEAAASARAMLAAYSEMIEAKHRELKKAHTALLEMSKMKDQFLSSMSHELRTPLNVILGLSDVMIQGLYGDLTEEQTENLSLINDSGRHLLDLVNRILDVAKIASGQEGLEDNSFSLKALCEDVISMFDVQAQKRDHSVLLETKGTDFEVKADERRMAQIFLNLLSNASKFTEPGRSIGIRLDGQDKEELIFEIWDEGIGIPEEKMDVLFEPFVQLDGGLAREYEGTGLGLALVKQLVDLHSGTISVQSTVGEGSVFSVRIPRVSRR